MRSLTAAEKEILAAADQEVRLRVLVEDGDGQFQDLSLVGGGGWVVGARWDEDIDQPVAQAVVEVWRDDKTYSLSPLRSDSKLNVNDAGSFSALVDMGREIKIETALSRPFAEAPYNWNLVFHGEIDEVDFAREAMQITARDLGGKLLDTWIEVDRGYGSGPGVAIQTVMQAILDDNSTGVTLYTPTSPAFNISPLYTQDRVSVMEALQTLAGLIGWDVRYKYDSGTSSFRLTLFEPDRAKTTPDWTFWPWQYLNVSRLAVSRNNVRNVVKLWYTDSSSVRQSYTASDAASITKYGRRFMEIEEADDSPIDTAAEATTMADDILSDLKDPKAEQEIECHYFYATELADLYRLKANAVHYDSDQDWAVANVRHVLDPKQHRTVIQVRGKPAVRNLGWLKRDIRRRLERGLLTWERVNTAIAADGRPKRSNPFDDGKYALKAQDSTGQTSDGDVFIPAASTVKVGVAGTPSSITKKIRIPHAECVPQDDTKDYVLVDAAIRPRTLISVTFRASIVLPQGITITAFRARMYRQTTSDTADASLVSVNEDATTTSLATVTHSSTGWQTVEATGLTELVPSNRIYICKSTLLPIADASDARLMFFELEYTMPSYDKAY